MASKRKRPKVQEEVEDDDGTAPVATVAVEIREHPTAKGKKNAAATDGGDGGSDDKDKYSVSLGETKKVRVNEFRGKLYVDIREFYTKDGKSLPGKKGISLNKQQWEILLEHADEITAVLEM